ncbi:unnamed protein product [Owenia fusiformis]|uniref:Uncharacterized protein n=1 Tax=Owenia fusiformis TaxID=6347 RepID=A0A8J1UXK0_OWEFU|nr:unnamed protein product [Owenia fusiformis]
MSKRKKNTKNDDYLYWDEMSDDPLKEILGDLYTASGSSSESSSDSSPETPKHQPESQKGQKKQNNNIYKCSQCTKELKSISGLRGHMRSHGIESVRPRDYRINHLASHSQPNRHPLSDKDIFDAEYEQIVNIAVKEAQKDNIYRDLLPEAAIQFDKLNVADLKEKTELEMYNVLLSYNSDCSLEQGRESLFANFHQLRLKTSFVNAISSHCNLQPHLVQTILRLLLKVSLNAIASLSAKDVERHISSLSESQKKVMHYIAGYLLRTMKRMKMDKEIRENFVKLCSTTKNDTVPESKWTSSLDRGGLMYPSTKFFELVLLFEKEISTHVNIDNPSANCMAIAPLTEAIMSCHAIQCQWECITSGIDDITASKVFELIITKFLRVRGYDTARLLKHRHKKSKKSTSKTGRRCGFRKGLKEKRGSAPPK